MVVRVAVIALITFIAAAHGATNPLAERMALDVFDAEIEAFEAADAREMPEPGRILFVGSSSIRYWQSLETDMAPLRVLNRGFGGAHIHQLNHYFERIVVPYAPTAIVFYCGENDINGLITPRQVLEQFKHFLALKDAAYGEVPVYFVSIKPSISRWKEFELQGEANALVRELAASRDDLNYIDVVADMLDEGRPRDIFVADGLHMNAAGYLIWTEAIKSVLEQLAAL